MAYGYTVSSVSTPGHGSSGAASRDDTRNGHTHKARLPLLFAAALAAVAAIGAVTDRAAAGGVLSVAYADAPFTGDPLVIDNPYWPLNPDSQTRVFTFEAETGEGCIIEEATVYGGGPYKTLNGALPYTGDDAVVVEDIGYFQEDCTGAFEKVEHTFDWYRQDDYGNVWYVGELSLDYENDGCGNTSIDPSEVDMAARPDCYAGSWEAGMAPTGGGLVAEAGIVVPSDLPLGPDGPVLDPGTYYLQELADDAMDVAKVLRVDTKVKYKIDGETVVLHHCRVTKEYSSLAPGEVEQKNYCPDDGGLSLIEEMHGEATLLVVLTDISPALP